ncbi:MAG: hypothetical protein M3033_18505 [Acidobacteriota bacterium]|nr:hypothetical protein [Acidobacteriota bacterium]
MAQDNDGVYNDDTKNTTDTGSDIPGGDGTISDEDMHAISGGKSHKGGQDHSLENYEDSEPTGGVGAIQSSSLIKEHIAHIEDDEE